MGFQWEVSPNQSFDQLVENYTNTIFSTGRRVAEQRAQQMEAWARSNAKWTDRTGAARRGLHAIVLESPGVIAQIIISHDPNLDYPIWLEISNAGFYSIIAPTIDRFAPIFMQDIQRIVNLGLASR